VLNLRFALAVAASAAVILSAPFIRDIRDWIRAQFPGHFVAVVAALVGIAIAAAVIVALVRIRERRLVRYAAIVAALLLGTAYAMWNAQGIPEVDAVERFHFVEYGILTLLFYRAYRPIGDASRFILPVLAGLLVGTLEEWLQWFIPGRVGDMRDVFLNGAAIVSGLLFSLGLDPPARLASRLREGSWRRVGMTASVVTLIFATFVHAVHFGYEISDPDAGRFRSRYDVPTLARISQDRASEWATAPPLERPQRLTREDQYMSEGLLHVQERNRGWSAGDFGRAWSENLILEKFYTPVLDTPSYVSKTGHRWPDAQRVDADQRSRDKRLGSSYESMADAGEGKHFIRLWPRALFWTVVLAAILAIIVLTTALDRSSSTRAAVAHSV
jgi:VanZ like family